MSDPVSVMGRLDQLAAELDELSRNLAEVERRLVPTEAEYEEFMASFEEGLWQKHVQDGEKLPPEKLRERMAHRAMPAELLGRYTALVSQRRRIRDRVGSVKAVVDAQRSILSALKAELDAGSSPSGSQPAWSGPRAAA